MSKWQLPRRTFLKGAGVSILLPMLDVMVPSIAKGATPGAPRFAALFLPHSIYGRGYDPSLAGTARYFEAKPWEANGQGAWRPKNTGAFSGPLPVHLQPLEAFRNKISVISGLTPCPDDAPGQGDSHSKFATLWLTSPWRKQSIPTAAQVNNPPDSVDQYIANAYGYSPGSTIVFNPSEGDFSEGPGGHLGYISSNSKLGGGTIVPKEKDPAKVFQRLFGSCNPGGTPPSAASVDDKSILDFVMAQIATVKAKLGKDDKARLDSYLQNIRDLETKIAGNTTTTCPAVPSYNPALNGSNLDWVAVNRMMVDVIALALASDAMPIATHMFDNEINGNIAFWDRVKYVSDFVGIGGQKINLDVNLSDLHDPIIHQAWNGNVDKIEQYIAITRMSMSFVQRLFQKLDSMPAEPNGYTPLDNSMILLGSGFSDGSGHMYHNTPTVLGGGKKFGLRQGQHIAFPQNTNLADFYYTMLKAMNVPGVTSFNGGTNTLNGIFG